jgi:hypothetical protein
VREEPLGAPAPPTATALILAGPAFGLQAEPSSPFTVSANGAISGAVEVTPTASGGGSFAPATMTLTAELPTATFVYTPTISGRLQIGLTNSRGLTNPAALTYESRLPPSSGPNKPQATALNLAGPNAGDQNQPSRPFTVSANGSITAAVVVTPTTTGVGSFSPRSVTLTANAPTATFIFTPTAGGRLLLGLTNGSGLANPTPVPFESRGASPAPETKPPATALYLAGPVSGRPNQASEPFTVSANGTISGSVVVTPTSSSAGSFTPKAVTLNATTPTATFVFTPSGTGAAQIALANTGGLGNPKPLPYESRVVTVDRLVWYVDVNPARPFGTSQGAVPAGAGNKSGQPNLIVAGLETVSDDRIPHYKLHERYANMTPTEIRKGEVTPTFPMVRRVADPADGSKWAYHLRINKKEVGIDGRIVTVDNVSDSYRCEVSATGTTRFAPAGTEEWAICGIRLPEYWRTIDTTRDWYVLFQFKDSDNGLTGNPTIAVGWQGGNGNPNACKFNWIVRRYNNANWPAVQTKEINRSVYHGTINNPAADIWHWLIFNYRTGCGYTDPRKGAIYGPTNPNDCFVKLYHAVGNGAAYLAGSYTGFWGSPYPSNDPRVTALAPGQQFPEPGYWKHGLYLKSRFLPASLGDDRDLMTKGYRVYRASDSPAMTVADVLRDFRGS